MSSTAGPEDRMPRRAREEDGTLDREARIHDARQDGVTADRPTVADERAEHRAAESRAENRADVRADERAEHRAEARAKTGPSVPTTPAPSPPHPSPAPPAVLPPALLPAPLPAVTTG